MSKTIWVAAVLLLAILVSGDANAKRKKGGKKGKAKIAKVVKNKRVKNSSPMLASNDVPRTVESISSPAPIRSRSSAVNQADDDEIPGSKKKR